MSATKNDDESLAGAVSGEPQPQEEVPAWEDFVHTEPELPKDYTQVPGSFDATPPPQLIRTVNLLPVPEHDLRGPDDLDGIAARILERTKEGIGDIFDHDDYAGYEREPTEGLARAIAEHQTGIPYTMPAYFYGAQKKVAEAIVSQGRYPLVGQCQQSVTTALCFGGWDGGTYGDIGSGKDSQPYCASLGKGWKNVPLDLKKWSDELWDDVKVGSCLFWSTDSPGVGHVVMVIRKHPDERKWQLWDTGTSFYDRSTHAGAAKGARMLWESHWWDNIPPTISSSWAFRGIGLIKTIGGLRTGLRPRGRTRLLLTRRSDKKLLFRSEWMNMESAGLPISWLLRGLRGAPFSDKIEAMFCVNSPPGQVSSFPDGLPVLDCIGDASGAARMTWSWQWKQGYHERKNAASWKPDAPYRDGATQTAQDSAAGEPSTPQAGALRSERLRGIALLEQIAAGKATLKQGARGSEVKAVQQGLIDLGMTVPGGADGIFGKGTAEALKKIQSDADLTATGIVDAPTIKALDGRLADKAAT